MPETGEATVGTMGGTVIVVSVAFLAAGIMWPQSAGALLRVLFAALAVAVVAVHAYEALLHVKTTRHTETPFDRTVAAHGRIVAPHVLRTLTLELAAADDARRSQRTAIPWAARRTLIADARRRLAEHHNLNLADASHHPRIRALVSPRIWLLFDAGDTETAPAPATRSQPVPLSELGGILDELERL